MYLHLYISIYIYMCVNIYIHTEAGKSAGTRPISLAHCVNVYTYIYIHVCMHKYTCTRNTYCLTSGPERVREQSPSAWRTMHITYMYTFTHTY